MGGFKGAAEGRFMFPLSLSLSLSLGGRVWIDSWHSSCEVSRVTAWAQQMPLTHPGPKSQALQWDCRFFPTENKLQRSTQVVSWLLFFFLLAAKRSPVCGTFFCLLVCFSGATRLQVSRTAGAPWQETKRSWRTLYTHIDSTLFIHSLHFVELMFVFVLRNVKTMWVT